MKNSKLRLLREERGLSIAELAEAVPCNKSTISLWERGHKEPSPMFRKGYAKALRLTMGDLGRHVYEGTER